MSKYKFDVSLVTSGLSEGVFELQPSDYSLEYILANQTGVTQKDFWKNGGD